MGIISSSSNLIKMNRLRFEIEEKIDACNKNMMKASETMSELESVQNDLDPNSPEYKKLDERKKRLKALDEKLNNMLIRYQTQQKMIEAQFDEAQQSLDKNIQYFYK